MSHRPVQIVDTRPPAPEQIEFLNTAGMIGFGITAIAFICVVIAASLVAAKARLPGRFGVLSSILLLFTWWIFEQSMGGSLEMTFGPQALLVSPMVYAIFSTIFSFGFVRMCRVFLMQAPAHRHES